MANAIATSALFALAVTVSSPLMASAQVAGSSSSNSSSSPTQSSPPSSGGSSSSIQPPLRPCEEAKALTYADYGANGIIFHDNQCGVIQLYAYLKWDTVFDGKPAEDWVTQIDQFDTYAVRYPKNITTSSTVYKYEYSKDPRTIDPAKDKIFAKAHYTVDAVDNPAIEQDYYVYFSVDFYGLNPKEKTADLFPMYKRLCDTRPT